MKITCGIFANIAPLYSEPLWRELASSANADYYFYSSRKGVSSIKTIDISHSRNININGSFNWYFLRNIYIKNILVYQFGAVYRCLVTKYNTYIFNGEMNCLSSWIAAIVCKLKRKPVIFWGHGLYGNEKPIKKFFRIMFYKMADYHLVYGNRSRNLMLQSGFAQNRVYTVYNSLNFHTHKKYYSENSKEELLKIREELFPLTYMDPVLLFLGRLTREKKLHYLIRAVGKLREKGRKFNCLVVGAGEEMQKLKDLTDSLELKDSFCFLGESYDEAMNARFIMLSDCCISPGNVGLTAIHSLSLGTPVITHDNPGNQGPEYEVIIPGISGQFFREDDIDDLAAVIANFVSADSKMNTEKHCIEIIEEHWTPENQRRVFDEVIRLSVGAKPIFSNTQTS